MAIMIDAMTVEMGRVVMGQGRSRSPLEHRVRFHRFTNLILSAFATITSIPASPLSYSRMPLLHEGPHL